MQVRNTYDTYPWEAWEAENETHFRVGDQRGTESSEGGQTYRETAKKLRQILIDQSAANA